MKKTISFSLEEDIIAKIENYQKTNRLSSKSAALERIVLQSDNINMKEIIKEMLAKKDTEDINVNINKSENIDKLNDDNKDLIAGIQSCLDDMPE